MNRFSLLLRCLLVTALTWPVFSVSPAVAAPPTVAFSPPVISGSNSGAYSGDSADIDNDGDADLVVTNYADATVMLSDGTGAFTKGQTISGYAIQMIVLEDLDNDGDTDMVTRANGGFRAFLNEAGVFTNSALINTTYATWDYLVVADFDGDSLKDVIVSEGDQYRPGRLYKNQGDGTFALHSTVLGAQWGEPNVADSGDVDGDGDIDLIVADATVGLVTHINNGDGTFSESKTGSLLAGTPTPRSMAVADFDRDGHLDVALAGEDYDMLRVCYGNGLGDFPLQVPYALSSDASIEGTNIYAADVNGDGIVDIAVGGHAAGTSISRSAIRVALNNGKGDFGMPVDTVASEDSAWAYGLGGVLVGDANSDGKADLLAMHVNSNPLSNLSVSLNVSAQQESAPIGVDDSGATTIDTSVTVAAPGVLANDTDADTAALTAVAVDAPLHGTVVFSADGGYEYRPAAGWFGDDTFTYRAFDGDRYSAVTKVTVTTADPGLPPVANEDSATTSEDTTLVVEAPGVLGNDVDPEAGALTARLISSTTNGTLDFETDGSYTYRPNDDWSGPDSFTYAASDGGSESNAVVTITVDAVNDAPSFAPGGDVTVNEDSGYYGETWATGISTGPSDEQLQSYAFETQVANPDLFIAQPVVNAAGLLEFAPDNDANGSSEVTVTLTDDDTAGGPALSYTETFTITVSPARDTPVAVQDDYVATEDTTLTIPAPGVLANDINIDGDALFADPFDSTGFGPDVTADLNTGVVSIDGAFEFTPQEDFNTDGNNDDGTLYQVRHADGDSTFGTIRIAVLPVNDAPSFTESGDITVDEDSGDYDSQWASEIDMGAPNEYQEYAFDTQVANPGLFSQQPTVDGTGILTFAPGSFANGSTEVTVTLTDDDSAGGPALSHTETFTITINPLNNEPSFATDGDIRGVKGSGPWSQLWITGIDAGAPDESGQELAFDVDVDDPSLFSVQPVVAADGTLSFTPTADATGTTTVSVTLTDDNTAGGPALSHTETFVVTVAPRIQTTALNITSAAKATIGFGASYTLAGALVASGQPVPSQTVVVQSAPTTAGPFVDTSLQATTAADGTFSFKVSPTSATSYRVRYAGEADVWTPATSSEVVVVPAAWVSTPVAPSGTYVGVATAVTGTLKPAHTKNGTVRLYRQRYVGGHWVSYDYVSAVSKGTGSSSSPFSASVTFPVAGRWRVRAYVPADGSHAEAWSDGYDYLTVGDKGARLAAIAKQHLGAPFLWGGTGPVAFDSSGFTQHVFAHAGIRIPRTAKQQSTAGTYVARKNLRPGDLVFFYSPVTHVGIYIGNGKMIDCNRPGGSVGIRTIYPGYATARRVW